MHRHTTTCKQVITRDEHSNPEVAVERLCDDFVGIVRFLRHPHQDAAKLPGVGDEVHHCPPGRRGRQRGKGHLYFLQGGKSTHHRTLRKLFSRKWENLVRQNKFILGTVLIPFSTNLNPCFTLLFLALKSSFSTVVTWTVTTELLCP